MKGTLNRACTTYDFDSTLGYPGEGPGIDRIKIHSQNIGGAIGKWYSAISAHASHKPHIICFQEINLKKQDSRIEDFRDEASDLGYVAFISPISPSVERGGTAILVSRSLERDPNFSFRFASKLSGAVTICYLSVGGTPLMDIASAYAPVDDVRRVTFLEKLKRASFISSRTMICTDANCVPAVALDTRREATSPYHNHGSDILQEIVNKYDLHDEIRLSLGLDFEFTHTSETTSKLADGTTITQVALTRIDQMFCPVIANAHWTCTIDETIYAPNKGVHKSLIGELEFRSTTTENRRDLASIDASVLTEPYTRGKVDELIKEFDPKFTENGSEFAKHWNKFKFELRSILKKATKHKRQYNQLQAERLRIELKALTAELKDAVADPYRKASEVLHRKEARVKALREIRISRNEGSAKLAYASLRREEQMSAQYFRRAFKSDNSQNFINELNNVKDWDDPPDKNKELRDRTTDCADAAANYFKHLSKLPAWTQANEDAASTLLAELSKRGGAKGGITDEAVAACSALISEKEVYNTCIHLPSNKAAGPDRIPNEFYKLFSGKVSGWMTLMFNEIQAGDRLPKNFSEGVITLLHKKNTRLDVRNYRPITLLNGDYKILTRILSKRMRDVVSQCVSDNQIGFVPRCFIAEANHLLKLIQVHIDNIDEGGLLVFFDFEKAFDRVSWQYMKRAMRALRFSGHFMSWVDKLYDENNPSTRRLYVNGKLSSPFKIYTGTAQGCPLSPLLFLIVTEGLTRRIMNNNSINGIQIGDTIHKISQYADDTTAILRGVEDLPHVDKELELWCKATNMLENTSKREYLPLGKLRDLTPQHPEWCQPGHFIISLGIPLGIKFNLMDFMKSKYLVAKKSLAHAVTAGDSIVGKHRLLSAKYYGKFRYYLWHEVFPKELHKAIQQDAKRFLWRRRPRLDTTSLGGAGALGKFIAKKAENRPSNQGGAGVSNWEAHVKAFQISWVEGLFAPRQPPWISIIQHWLKIPLGSLCFKVSNYRRNKLLRKIPTGASFFREALGNFLKYNPMKFDKSLSWVTHPDEIKGMPFQFNPFIKNQPNNRIFETLYLGAFHIIGSIFDDEKGDFFTDRELKNLLTHSIPNNKRARVFKWLTKFRSELKSRTRLYSLLTSPPPPVGELSWVAFTNDQGHPATGKISKSSSDELSLQEMEVDLSGFAMPIGTPHDLESWDDNDLTDIRPATTWGPTQLILGPTHLHFPLPQGWIIPTLKDENGMPTTMNRDKLSVSLLTKLLTPPSSPPNCEAKWEYIFNIILPWSDVWKGINPPLTTTRDRKTIHKLLHRSLHLRGTDSKAANKRCRACGRCRESLKHFTECRMSHPIRLEAIRYIKSMGIDVNLIDPQLSWLTMLDTNLKILPPMARTIIVITNRVIYRHLTAVDGQPSRPWDTMNVMRDISAYLMKRILAFQQERRNYYLLWQHQKFRQQGTALPKSMLKFYSPIGKLDTTTGSLEVNDAVVALLKKAKCWKKFKLK